MKSLLLLIFLSACSTTPKEFSAQTAKKSNEVFKKEKPLNVQQVPDFYPQKINTLSPALQDETTDRYKKSEMAKVEYAGDPLLEINFKCQKGDFSGAFEAIDKSFQRYQKIPSYWNQVGNCHLNAGSFRKALLFYNKALEVDSNYVPALNNIGVMYSRLGQDQKALVAFEKSHKISRFSKTPRLNLAIAYLRYGLTDEALPLVQGLLNNSPSDVDLLNCMANIHFINGNFQTALNYYQQIPTEEWRRPEIGINLSWTLKNLNRVNDSKKVFGLVSSPKTTDLKNYYLTVKKILGGEG